MKSGVVSPNMMFVLEAPDSISSDAINAVLLAENIERMPQDMVVVLRRFDEDDEVRFVSATPMLQPHWPGIDLFICFAE